MIHVARVETQDFNDFGERVHWACFREVRPKEKNTCDYVVMAFEDSRILGYATIIEMDKETAYMQHGGAVPEIQGTPTAKKVYRVIMAWVKEHYKRISTQIQNTNTAMIKFALSEGFLINGVLAYGDGEIFLQLIQGF